MNMLMHALLQEATIPIRTELSPEEVMDLIRRRTVDHPSQVGEDDHEALFYGSVGKNDFQVRELRYSPMSIAPVAEGRIQKDGTGSKLLLTIDIRSHYKMIRQMYAGTMMPVGILGLLSHFIWLQGSDLGRLSLFFGIAFLLGPLAYIFFTRYTLIRIKEKKIRLFTELLDADPKGSSEDPHMAC